MPELDNKNTKTSESITENIRENLQHKADKGEMYEVHPVSKDTSKALEEIKAMQDNLMADYSVWAQEAVRYDELEDDEVQTNLRISSDNYTMQMFMNCFTGFQDGITVSSLFSTMLTFKIQKVLNPGFEQDVSRMYSNLRDQIVPTLEERYDQLPAFQKIGVGSAMKMFLDYDKKYGTPFAAQATHNTMVDALKSNTLDEMVMTPRQVAVLKVNFMEQYYSDLRSCDVGDKSVNSDYNKCKHNYEVAMKHLNRIAHNSGFDMSVVAEEERYIVGMKIMDNPRYGAMFAETCHINNIEPVYDSDGTWNGKFETRDGHAFTTGADSKMGTFTVREPKSNQAAYEDMITKSAEGYGAAVSCTNSLVEAGIDSDKLKAVQKSLDKYKNEYRERMVAMLEDDLDMSSSEARKYFDNIFDKTVNTLDEESKEFFTRELNYAVDKDVCGNIGIALPDYKKDDSPAMKEAKTKAFAHSLLQANNQANPGDTRDALDVMTSLRQNYMISMSNEDLFKLVVRANANWMQGRNATNEHEGHIARCATFDKKDDSILQNTHYSDVISSKPDRVGVDLSTPEADDEFSL